MKTDRIETHPDSYITPIVLGDSLPNGEQSNRLTKREYFASQMMSAWISADHVGNAGYPYEEMAKRAVECSDALITELNKQP